jgi:hypothetical protein
MLEDNVDNTSYIPKDHKDLVVDKKEQARLLIEETFRKIDFGVSESELGRQREELKTKVYPLVLIDKNISPESFFELQRNVARELGHGDIQVNEAETIEIVYENQKTSLDVWFNYMFSKDSTSQPWFKAYALGSVINMTPFSKEKGKFLRRSQTSASSFPEFNAQAVAGLHSIVTERFKSVDQNDFYKLLSEAKKISFSQIYGEELIAFIPASKENKEITEGEWVCYKQGSDVEPFFDSLQGHGTGWCTEREKKTAELQLKGGDFYVYYSKDIKTGKDSIPRIAIRMEKGQIAEVRGIGVHQEMEGNMLDIAREKYIQLPGGDKFEKKTADMKLMTQIDKKVKENKELTRDELRFLYEIDDKIEGFGHWKDPRIETILKNRGKRKDLSFIFNCRPEQISFIEAGIFSGDIKFHYGNLELSYIPLGGIPKLPECVIGDLTLNYFVPIEKLPKEIKGGLSFRNTLSWDEQKQLINYADSKGIVPSRFEIL